MKIDGRGRTDERRWSFIDVRMSEDLIINSDNQLYSLLEIRGGGRSYQYFDPFVLA